MNKLPRQSLPWPITWDGVVEIAKSESCRLKAYQDIVGVWTIGWGETEGVHAGLQWSQAQADEQFCARLAEFSAEVRAACVIEPNENELAAMVSFAYNVGVNGFKRSSVLRCHNAGDQLGASRAFGLWNKAGGKVVNGLVRRRAREAAMYLTPAYETNGVPQRVDAESGLHASPIAQSGVVSLVTGILGVASQFSGQAKGLAENLSINPVAVAAVVALVVGGVTLYQRYKQRKEGWA